MNRAQVLEQLAQSRAVLAARYGVTGLALFGSMENVVRYTASLDRQTFEANALVL